MRRERCRGIKSSVVVVVVVCHEPAAGARLAASSTAAAGGPSAVLHLHLLLYPFLDDRSTRHDLVWCRTRRRSRARRQRLPFVQTWADGWHDTWLDESSHLRLGRAGGLQLRTDSLW